MKSIIRQLLPHIAIFTALFLILPLVLRYSVVDYRLMDIIFVLLFAVNPVVVIVFGAVFGALNGLKIFYPFIAPLLFILSMWIIYNFSAFIYAVYYFVLSLIGLLTGSLFYYISGKHKSGSKRNNFNKSNRDTVSGVPIAFINGSF